VDFLEETTFRPLGGATPQSLIRARDWPSLNNAHPNGDEGPPQKNLIVKIKKWLKIQRIDHYNFGASGSIPTKHFPYDVPRDRGHNVGITLGRPAP